VILLEEHALDARVPDFENGGYKPARLLHRVDPLFGHGARIIEGAKLQPAAAPLGEIVERQGFCPFCADTIEEATAPFPPEIATNGRIIVNNSWVVPNVLAYSAVSAVGIYDITRHFVPIEEIDRELLHDVLLAVLRHGSAVRALRPELAWSSVNANYLYPSGSSLVHPHIQSSHDPVPLGSQARLVGRTSAHQEAYERNFFQELIDLEELQGDRFVARTEPFVWLVPFAPSGFYEVWAIAPELGDLPLLTEHDVYQLASGIAVVLESYVEVGLQSFNFSLLGAGPDWERLGGRLLFRMVARAPLTPYYRSDVTYFERLCLESMIDYEPEQWATTLRAHFGPRG